MKPRSFFPFSHRPRSDANAAKSPASRWRRSILALGAAATLAACAPLKPAHVAVVQDFDIERYLGRWYEIARMDHSFERGMDNVYATYSFNPDGSLHVVNRGYNPARGKWHEAIGRGLFTGSRTSGELKVSFFGPFYGGYNIVMLDPGYRWAVVMGPDPSYFWILSRSRQLPAALLQGLTDKIRALGGDSAALIWVDQSRELETTP